MRALLTTQHITEFIKDPLHPSKRTRRIGRSLNYWTPDSRLWRKSANRVELASSIPPDWSGNFDFSYTMLSGPLQTFIGGTRDTSNRAMWGVRLGRKPDSWMNWRAFGATAPNPPEVLKGGRILRWVELWKNTDLELRIGTDTVEKRIILKAPGHPAAFRFTMHHPQAVTHTFINNGITFQNGDEWFVVKPAWGEDSATDGMGPLDENPIRVLLGDGGDIRVGSRSFPSALVTPNPDDLAGATYPVMIDPTTTIDDTGIEDAFLNGNATHNNYGGRENMITGNTADHTAVMRLSDIGDIPAGTIDAATLYAYNWSSTTAVDMNVYILKDANSWGEGTSNGASESGACDSYDYAHGTGTWAGSNNARTSGTDYDADGSPPNLSMTSGQGTQGTVAFDTSVVEAWRDATRNNNGWLLRTEPPGTTSRILCSTEFATAGYRPDFEIDYTETASAAFYYSMLMRHQRG